MGHINPFFEKAGFTRVGVTRSASRSIEGHSAIWGCGSRKHGQKRLVSKETFEKSRYSEPVYYVFDNRKNNTVPQTQQAGEENSLNSEIAR